MIEVKHLVKRYGNDYAVDDLSFTVQDGEIFGFLGPNGAGKSTTMNIMTGYLAASSGQVLIENHDILEEPEAARRCIGYLPEIPPLYPDMTALEYLRFCAELKKIPKQEQQDQIHEVLKLTQLEDMSGRLIKNLSKGYKQRVGLAQAILGFPKIMILDEPTVGLDPRQVVEIRQLIRQLSKSHTMILSSHILSEIRAVCNRVLIIRKGRFVVCDTPERLEETLSGGNSLFLIIHGRLESIESVLRTCKSLGVADWTILDNPENPDNPENSDNHVHLSITMESGQDIREALFFAFARARLPILEMRIQKASLEDAFLGLTNDDDDIAAKAAALFTGASPEKSEKSGEEEIDIESDL